MSSTSAPLFLALEPSPRLRRFLIVVHALAAVAALVNGLPWWVRVAALSMVAASTRHHLHQAARPPIPRLSVDAEQDWRLGHADGTESTARLQPGSVVSRWGVVLQFRDDHGGFHAVPVLPDSVDGETYRKLCVLLRNWKPAE